MWLLIGGDSEVGAATLRHAQGLGRPVVATTRRQEHAGPARALLDLSRPLGDWGPPAGVDAACIFVAVARLAACASDPEGSEQINVSQTLRVARKLIERGIYVLFLSTNQVFDGTTPHVAPDAQHSPVSEYGRQKARTETALFEMMARGAPAAILRLAKVVSPDMALLRGWIDTLGAGKPIRAFHDMTMAPTPTALVATAIGALMEKRASGIFQLTGPQDWPYADIGRHLARRIGADPALVESVSAASVGMPQGATPPYTTLDSSLMRERFGLVVPDVAAVAETVIAANRR